MADASCIQGSMCYTLVQGVPAAIVAVAIGALTLFIAWKQKEIARAKLKLDLFDRRMDVFKKTKKIFEDVLGLLEPGPSSYFGPKAIHEPTSTDPDLPPFYEFIHEAEFLFGDDIRSYLNVVSIRWAELKSVKDPAYRKDPDKKPDPSRVELLEKYFYLQLGSELKKVFKPYLGFNEWK